MKRALITGMTGQDGSFLADSPNLALSGEPFTLAWLPRVRGFEMAIPAT